MIKLENIVVSSLEHKDGSIEYRAQLLLQSYHRLTPMMLQDLHDLAAVKANIKEDLQQRIWDEVYRDLQQPIFELLHEVKAISPAQGATMEMQNLVNKLQAMLA